jgi:hypothetical protein
MVGSTARGTSFAPLGPRDREPLWLGLCSQMQQILLPPSLSPLLQAQN